jgi:hypothetical protein
MQIYTRIYRMCVCVCVCVRAFQLTAVGMKIVDSVTLRMCVARTHTYLPTYPTLSYTSTYLCKRTSTDGNQCVGDILVISSSNSKNRIFRTLLYPSLTSKFLVLSPITGPHPDAVKYAISQRISPWSGLASSSHVL